MNEVSYEQVRYSEIVPGELADIGLPVWGDKVYFSPDAKAPLQVGGYPKSAKVILGYLPLAPVSGTSMRNLLKAASRVRLRLTEQCAAGPLSSCVADEVVIEVKTALEHYRSLLDYLAHDIYQLCKPAPGSSKPRKLYFPIAGFNETNADFHRRFQKDYSQLRITAPKVFQHIIDIQRFSGETWLNDLASLVNPMKHLRLAEWEEIDCKSLIIHHDGVGIRIGELGLRLISIPKNREIHLISPSGVNRAIRGPQEIDINTATLFDADPEIKLDLLMWKTTAIKGTGRSIAGLLAEIDGGVRMVCKEVTCAIHGERKQEVV